MAEIRRLKPGSAAFADSLELRYRVMYEPFGLERELAPGLDAAGRIHVGAFDDGRLVGYARLAPFGKELKLYQVVVEPGFQGRGIGAALVGELVGIARAQGARSVVLDARLPAVAFYERLGFVVDGPEFLMPRTHMPHLPMRLDGL